MADQQLARRRTLMVRETRAEPNRTIVVAIDTGCLMSEPLHGGLPRVDRAVNAAPMLAYVGLKVGDRVGLFAFAGRPRLDVPPRPGVDAFARLLAGAGGLDCATEETNHALGLSTLAAGLPERAVVAGGMLRERDLVLRRLARLGAGLLEAPAAAAGPALLRRFLALKREDRI